MSKITDHIHSVYRGNIKDASPIGTHRLYDTLKQIKCADPKTIDLIKRIRAETNEDKKAQLKWKLRAYTPSTVCTGLRRYDNIKEFSGLMSIDFDKLPDRDYAIGLKEHLFEHYPFIYASWLSSSGLGVRAILRIPIVMTTNEFKALFDGFREYKVSDNEYLEYFDSAPKNAVLPLFQSYDPDLLYRWECDVWNRTYIEPEPITRQIAPLAGITDQDKRRVIAMVQSSIDKINGNGHPQLRGASFALGGYVGAGYIDQYEAIQLMESLIDANSYLSKKPKVYKITARQMIRLGQSQPIYLQ